MYQGDIVRLKNRTNSEMGWYQKLRCNDSNVYFINLNDTNNKIKENCVDANNTKDDKQYVVINIISGEDVIKYSHFNISDELVKDINKQEQIKYHSSKLDKLKLARMNNGECCRDYLKFCVNDEEYKRQIEELEKIIKTIKETGVIEYIYMYGKHIATSNKEYCWLVPVGFNIKVGDTVVVDTVIGVNKAIVTRLELSTEIKEVKSVLRKC